MLSKVQDIVHYTVLIIEIEPGERWARSPSMDAAWDTPVWQNDACNSPIICKYCQTYKQKWHTRVHKMVSQWKRTDTDALRVLRFYFYGFNTVGKWLPKWRTMVMTSGEFGVTTLTTQQSSCDVFLTSPSSNFPVVSRRKEKEKEGARGNYHPCFKKVGRCQ